MAAGLKMRGYRVFASARKERDVERLQVEGFESLQLDLDDSESINVLLRESQKKLTVNFMRCLIMQRMDSLALSRI